MRILIVGLFLGLFFLAGCGSDSTKTDDEIMKTLKEDSTKGPSMDEEVINGILQSIPSPLEISVLLKNSGKKYDVGYLNSPNNVSNYNSNFKKALNLGIYGTDLGYTNIYEQNQDGLKYIATIKDLADELSIGQFFDIETIGRLASNSKNLDSLLLITTQNFNNINHYLQTQNRANLSVLLLVGGWVEALHITCEVASNSPNNKDLHETIGQQKIILENIKLLLTVYAEGDPNMASLLKDVQELEKTFNPVKITYEYQESTFEIVDGVMVIKDNSTSTIHITPEDVVNIKNKINEIRTTIIS